MKKDSDYQVAFTGDVRMAKCPCHYGWFYMQCFMIDPEILEKQELAKSGLYKNRTEITQEIMNDFINTVACDFLKHVGVKDYKKAAVENGKKALDLERKYMNERNPDLN